MAQYLDNKRHPKPCLFLFALLYTSVRRVRGQVPRVFRFGSRDLSRAKSRERVCLARAWRTGHVLLRKISL